MTLLNAAQFVLSGFLTYACFCRLRKTDTQTIDAIRHAFALMATIMLFVCARTLFVDADPVLVLSLLGMAAVQAATAVYWPSGGVPAHFIKSKFRKVQKQRSSDSKEPL